MSHLQAYIEALLCIALYLVAGSEVPDEIGQNVTHDLCLCKTLQVVWIWQYTEGLHVFL